MSTIKSQMRKTLTPEQSRVGRFCVHMTSDPRRWCTEDEVEEIYAFQNRAISIDEFTYATVYMSEKEFIQEISKEPIKSILDKLREGMGLSFIYGNDDMR